jgi:hypothetical protein
MSRPWEDGMTAFSTKTFAIAAALGACAGPALAQTGATPWELKPDMGYAYDRDGKTYSYKMGTSNAGELLKGAKKVPKGTLFFIGQNGPALHAQRALIWRATASFKFGPGPVTALSTRPDRPASHGGDIVRPCAQLRTGADGSHYPAGPLRSKVAAGKKS